MPFGEWVADGDHDAGKIRVPVTESIGTPKVVDHKLGRVPTEVVIVMADVFIQRKVTAKDRQKVVLVFDATDADIILRIA